MEAENAFSLCLVRAVDRPADDRHMPRVAPDVLWEMKMADLKKSGLLAFSTGGFPSTAFAQTQLPFRLEAARRSAPLTDTRGDGISSVNALESVGDLNGDGWADLLVTRSTAAEDVTSEVYFGGGRPFAIRAKDSGFTSGGAIEFNFQ